MRYLLHDVFTQAVKDYPNKSVIINEDKATISYSDLNKLTNQFSNIFIASKAGDIRNKPYVGILSNVNTNSIASIIGALKIGGAYVPLDEKSPEDRLSKIIDNAKLDLICIDPFWYEEYKELILKYHDVKWIFTKHTDLSDLPPNILTFANVEEYSTDELPEINQVSDDLAYILHSSGSTGIPKGIMLTHRNARTFVDWMHKEFDLTNKDIVMSRAPFKFDLSVFDIFNTFKAGATLACFDWNGDRDTEFKHKDYVNLIQSSQATILYTTPSTFITLINKGGLANVETKLRTVMYAGEPFPIPQLRKLKEVLPNTKIANIYGPTETNIITYYWVEDILENTTSIPLGNVVEDTEILIVSEDNKRICDPNEVGEIWCRGGTVTIGYLGMEEKTKDCLVLSPFHKFPVNFWTKKLDFHRWKYHWK